MKKGILVGIVGMVFAMNSYAYVDSAKVLSVQAVYKDYSESVPYQYCEKKKFWSNGNSGDTTTQELKGALLGGVIGNQFGGGSGKDAMTIFGALLGSSMAKDDARESNRGNSGYYYRDVCETRYKKNYESVVSHYRVKYEYNGNISYGSTRYKPNGHVKIRVSSTIVE